MKAVDELGAVQAAIASLRKEEAKLKGEIFTADQQGLETVGDLFKATVIEAERTTTDWKKIAIDLGASDQRIRANSTTQTVVSMKVTALSTAARKAA